MHKYGKGMLVKCGVLALVLAALVVPASASANLSSLYHEYTAHGKIDPCKHSTAELQDAIANVPTDVKQYDPRFVDELNRALELRSTGACSKKGKGNATAFSSDTSGGGGSGGGGSGTDFSGSASGGGGGGSAVNSLASDGSPAPVGSPAGTTAALAKAPIDLSADRGFPLPLAILAGLFALMLAAGGWIALSRRYEFETPAALAGPAGRIKDLGSSLRDRFDL